MLRPRVGKGRLKTIVLAWTRQIWPSKLDEQITDYTVAKSRHAKGRNGSVGSKSLKNSRLTCSGPKFLALALPNLMVDCGDLTIKPPPVDG